MPTISYQDKDIIIFHPYTWTGFADGIYLKNVSPIFNGASIGSDYKLLWSRRDNAVIQATTPFYEDKYIAMEPSLIGDVLILGAGLQTLDAYLSTGNSWKWVEKNAYLASIVPSNGTMHLGDAEDMEFIASLGMFDTILIDFPKTWNLDYSSVLNPGGTVIEFKI